MNNIKKKVGRPKKEKEIRKKDEVIVTKSVISKHVGYCPKCEISIMENDCSERKFVCKGCGEEDMRKSLKLERKVEKRNKKDDWEYLHGLESTLSEKEYFVKPESI